jgi:hypothetical protein
VKTAWSGSCILRVPATAGHLYFKATYARPPAEVAVVQELGRRWPRHVPTVVAADASRRWMLMEDFGPRELSGMPFARWPTALRLFGRIQRECSADLSSWRSIGCPDRRMEFLVSRLEPLLSDPLLADAELPFRLNEGDLERLRADRNRWAEQLFELGASPIPASIVQQDFRAGNVVVRGRTSSSMIGATRSSRTRSSAPANSSISSGTVARVRDEGVAAGYRRRCDMSG